MRDLSARLPAQGVYAMIVRRTPALQAAVVGLGLLLPPLAVVPLEAQKRIVDDALPAGDMTLLALLVGAYVAAAATAAALKLAIYYFRGLIEARVTRHLRALVVIAQQRRGGAAATAVGPSAAVLADEAHALGGFAAEAINTPLIEGGALVTLFGFMLATEPLLAAIGAGSLLLQAVVAPLVQRRINRLTADRVRALRRATAALIAASARRRGARYREALGEARREYLLRLRMNLIKAALKAFLKLADNVATALVLLAGGAMVMAGQTTLGVVVAFLSGMGRVREPWDALIGFWREFADADVKYRLIRESLVVTAPGPREAARARAFAPR